MKLAEQFGRKVATADEARKIMKVGVWYDTVEETLFNLGLPPNRAEGYQGFPGLRDDGRQAGEGTRGSYAADQHPVAGLAARSAPGRRARSSAARRPALIAD